MIKKILKIIIVCMVAYVLLLYWLDNKYLVMGNHSSVETNTYQNAIYFGGFFLCLGLDIKKSSLTQLYAVISIFSVFGFLMPSIEGKIMAWITLAFSFICGFFIIKNSTGDKWN